MIALALAPIIEKSGIPELAFWFREGPRNLPARMWLSGFTGEPTFPMEASRQSRGERFRGAANTCRRLSRRNGRM